MFDFNKALKEKEDREQAAKDKAAVDDASKSRNIKDLHEGLEHFIRSRNFGATVRLQGHKLILDTKFQGSLSVTAEKDNLFTIAPEKTDVVTARFGSIPSGIDLSAEGVTRILVEWIVPKS